MNIIGNITFKDSKGIIHRVNITKKFWINKPDLTSCVLYLRSLNYNDFQVNTIQYNKY